MSDLQRSIKRARVFRAGAVALITLNAFTLALNIAMGSLLALAPAALIVGLLVLIVMQTRMIGTLRRTQHLNWHAEQRELAVRAIRENTQSSCSHPAAVPVDLLLTGERVAWICPDCNAELPAGWKLTAKVTAAPSVCECPDETRDTVWVHVPERATWVASYCAACGRGTGTITSTGSGRPSGTAALSGTGALSAKARLTDGEVKDATEAAQHFAQLARVGRERCIGSCAMCAERDRQRAADESMRQWIEEGRWEQR